MKFSIIIPFRELDDYTEECITRCLRQDYKDFEIILLPDNELELTLSKTKIIPTGPIKPGIKRNIAVEKADGELLAFIDSDAFPERDWLKNSLKYFEDKSIAAVGGPNLTPPSDKLLQKISGDILASWWTGRSSLRYKIGKEPTFAKELITCNLIVRKDIFNKTDKFDPSFLTAEDTKLCFQIWDVGKKVMYAPDVIVYHHRRKIFKPHLRQMWIYGRDLAWLMKTYDFKGKFYYTMLSIFVIGLISGLILSSFNEIIRLSFFSIILTYLIITLIASIHQNTSRAFLIFLGLILTHFSYGLGLLYGLFTKKDIKALNLR